MTTLKKAPNGDWFARKMIPVDVRAAYKSAYGVSQEERFRRPASVPMGSAKIEFRDWDATITSRIEALRAAESGSKVQLSQRQLSALVGQWYVWFTETHSENPGKSEDWDSVFERLISAYDRYSLLPSYDEELPPAAKRYIFARVTEIGQVATFLAEHSPPLDDESYDAFLYLVARELQAALGVLRRRAEGDYSPDSRATKFAVPTQRVTVSTKEAGLNCWQAFEAWIAERKPAASTVNRWRAVFMGMNDHFQKQDVALIDADAAVKWKDTLVTADRSANVVNDIWIRAARTVFGWLAKNRKIIGNPFSAVEVSRQKVVKKRERAFEEHEWKAILTATLSAPSDRTKGTKAACRRWVPWLCAYTGARAGEMTQLQQSSVYQENGIWLINISPEDGTVKGSSFRKVPIHEHLIEQGFLDFVRTSGPGPLFYDPADIRTDNIDPTNPPRPPYVIARNKLAEWVRKSVGITDTDISPNHAWRHTFKRKAARCGMERRFRFAFCGHETEEIGDEYEIPTLEDMNEELKKFPRYEWAQL